jgi:apolipoprotein N-acyltransferase
VVAAGGSLALVAVAGLIASAAVASVRRRRFRPIVVAVGAATAFTTFGAVTGAALTHPAGRLRVAVVQGGGPRGVPAVRIDPSQVLRRTFSEAADVRAPVDLVLWPEDVVPLGIPLVGSEAAAGIGMLARRTGAAVVAGVTEPATRNRFRNEAVLFAADGRITDRYDKVHRVPFGEYVPARSLLERFVDLSQVPYDEAPGHGAGLLRLGGLKLGVAISYEVFFADRARAAVDAGGEVLLVPTNASSYRDDGVPAQEIAAARLRARETGRFVVQAAPTGYSAVITQNGAVVAKSPLGRAALLTRDIGLRRGRTFYTRVGDLPVEVLAALALGLACLPRITSGWRRARRQDT